MIFRLCAAGFALLLVLLSLHAIGCWYWYGDQGLKHKHQCALQLQTINVGLNKDSRALLVKLFYQNNNNGAAALREYRRIKDTGRSSFRTAVEEHYSEVQINWRFRNCSWSYRRPITPEIVEKVKIAHCAQNSQPLQQ